jgi:chaperone modulatory protein CbpM
MHSENTPAGIVGILVEEHAELTLYEVCSACAVEVEGILALVDEGVLSPVGGEVPQWRFSGAELRRATTALRLQRDLGINPAGVALALELLDEIEKLQVRLAALRDD